MQSDNLESGGGVFFYLNGKSKALLSLSIKIVSQ